MEGVVLSGQLCCVAGGRADRTVVTGEPRGARVVGQSLLASLGRCEAPAMWWLPWIRG